ncbi:MAG: hypothetical protein DI551_07515 [Micavibrio aeruginosavorus]|uniref:HTH cro/C1-type domain-containing protein n=1 Tax=Micavibrio aeruginosavorus TaxID=349221 RepID=A0A2W5MYD4_9BACT|nr:MAG: hypothetical protein DI551_07515 [Micavibrio aeruginosavorus]
MTRLKDIPDLAGRIKYIRHIKGLSQVELADIAGTTQQAIQQAESGKAQNPRYLHTLSHALGIPYEWLTMNIGAGRNTKPESGFSEKGREVVESFYAMPKKDQKLILELMKSRQKKDD